MAGKKKKWIVICLILCVIIATVVVMCIPKGKTGKRERAAETLTLGEVHTITPGARKTMENDRWLLELDEKTLAITLQDKKTGEIYETAKDYSEGNDIWNAFCASGVTLEFYSGNSTVATRVSPAKDAADIQVEYFADGFDADIAYPDYEFSMQLQVRLEADGVSVYVPGGSIKEGNDFLLGSVWLYPMLGSTYLGEEAGYMVIPEGVGALIDLADNHGKYKNPYTKRIYGGNVGTDAAVTNVYGEPVVTEPKAIKIPVFGMVYTERKTGFLGIVTDGEYNAVLNAYPNGVITPYNWVTAQFMVRDVYTKQTAKTSGVPTFESKGDIRSLGMRYLFVDGDEADYTGLANRYQDYLVSRGMLTKSNDDFRIKLDFLGADSKKWFLFNAIVPMTTVEELDSVLTDLIAENVTDILPAYYGWQKDGVTLSHGSSNTNVEPKLGSGKELKDLQEKLKQQNITLNLQKDLLLANASRLYNTGTDIVKGINQVIVEVPTYRKLFPQMYYLTPSHSEEILETMIKKYVDRDGFVLELSGVTENLFSYYSGGETYSRADTVAQYRLMLDKLDETVGMSAPNEYLWDRMDSYYDMSLATSGYNFISSEVPFLPIVLRGYVPYWASYANFEANEKEFFLKLLEYGAYPTFLLTQEAPVELRNTNSSHIYTSEYSVLKSKILQYNEEIGEVLSKVSGVGMEEHRYLTDKVVQITYKNGVEILINYSDADYSEEGVTVPALSYVCKEGSPE